MTNKPRTSGKILGFLLLIILVIFFISIAKSSDRKNSPIATISGISREDMEKEYYHLKYSESELKAQKYEDSLKDKYIEWVVEFENAKSGIFGQTLDLKYYDYKVTVGDGDKLWENFSKGDILLLKGRIKYADFDNNTVNVVGDYLDYYRK